MRGRPGAVQGLEEPEALARPSTTARIGGERWRDGTYTRDRPTVATRGDRRPPTATRPARRAVPRDTCPLGPSGHRVRQPASRDGRDHDDTIPEAPRRAWRPMLVFAACGGGASSPSCPARAPATDGRRRAERPGSEPRPVTIELAHSYQDAQPQVACGAKIIADEVAAANVGLTIELFGQSQLGSDADRIQSVVAGDIDMDIQGASALSAVYAPIGAVDGAFVFDDSEHMQRFFTDPASDALKQGFLDADRRAHPRRLEHRRPPVHGQQADPHPGRPPGPQDALPAVAAVPHERRGDGGEPGRGRVRRAVPRAPAGDRRRAGEPAHQHPGDQPPRGPGPRQPVEPPAQLEPGRDRQGLGRRSAPSSRQRSRPRSRRPWSRSRSASSRPRRRSSTSSRPAAPWRSIEDVDREAFRAKAEPYLRENFTPEQVVVLDAIRSTAQ